jgi:hypothetical protein
MACKRCKNTNIELGFVFVFFYGLERRLVLDVGAVELQAHQKPHQCERSSAAALEKPVVSR